MFMGVMDRLVDPCPNNRA